MRSNILLLTAAVCCVGLLAWLAGRPPGTRRFAYRYRYNVPLN